MRDLAESVEQDEEYHSFLAKGELRMQRCGSCGFVRHPARYVCPECLGEDWLWSALSGRGIVETFLWYFESFDCDFAELPYNVALVRLENGPRVYGNILGVEFGHLAVGDRVEASFVLRKSRTILSFRHAAR